MFAKARRLLASMLIATLAAGLVAQGAGAAGMDVKAAIIAAHDDMPMSGKCDGCAGNDKAMMPGACFTMCNNMVALPTISIAWAAVPAEDVSVAIVSSTKSHTGPPEPYPPRPIVLS